MYPGIDMRVISRHFRRKLRLRVNISSVTNRNLLGNSFDINEALFLTLCGSKPLVTATNYVMERKFGQKVFGPLFQTFVQPRFSAGNSLNEALSLSERLYSTYRVQAIIDESAEDVEGEEALELTKLTKLDLVQKLLHRLLTHPHGPKIIPIKCSSLVSVEAMDAMTKLSFIKYNLSPQSAFNALTSAHRSFVFSGLDRLLVIGHAAQQSNMRLLLDAEQSGRQPAIDIIYRFLATELNQKLSPLPTIYNTYQAYLHRAGTALLSDLSFCRENNVLHGIKLVRGAYLASERNNMSGTKPNSILPSKQEVDTNYNTLASCLVRDIANKSDIGLLLATHNRESVESALALMQELNVPVKNGPVLFAQILGICDNLTWELASRGVDTAKLLLYGDPAMLRPWLLRRLAENQDGLGAAQLEAKRLRQQIYGKLFSV